MRALIWTDKRGFRHRSFVKDDMGDDMAEFGIPADPPDLDDLDWEFVKKEINNALIDNGLFTWNDVNHSNVGLNAVVTVVKRQLSALYQNKDRQIKKREISQII